MDIKAERYDKLLCMACLCVEQELQHVTEEKPLQFYLAALREIGIDNTNIQLNTCEDCKVLLTKTAAFREQIKDSYKSLVAYQHNNINEYLSDTDRKGDLGDAERARAHSPAPLSRLFLKEEVKDEWGIDIVEHPLKLPDSDALSDVLSDKETGVDSEMDILISELKNDGQKKKKRKGRRKVSSKSKSRAQEDNEIDHIQLSSEDLSSGGELDETQNLYSNAPSTVTALPVPPKVKRRARIQYKIKHVQLTFEDMTSERELDRTKKSYLNAPYRCDTCILGFQYEPSYKTHMQCKHLPKLGDYVCPICNTIVSSVESFTSHYKRHMKRYECTLCQKRSASLGVMHQHYYSKHQISLKEYKCDVCGKVSNSMDAHRYHRDSHRARVPCRDCDKTFSHRAGLLNHRIAVHEKQNSFPCDVCSKSFRWLASLKRHQAQHHRTAQQPPESEAFCSFCAVSFASTASFQRHLKNSMRHVSHDELKFTCDHCQRRFADKTKLRNHIEEKHLHHTYQCPICHKPSKNRVTLDQHVRNVHRGRPNNKMCHHCGKSFPTKMQLESHIRTHTGERPFICDVCPTTFSQQSNLYKHNRQVHMNIKSKRSPRKKDSRPDVPAVELSLPAHRTMDPQAPVATLHYTPDGFIIN